MADPRRLLWSERDAGQKLSMLLGGLCFLALTGLMTFAGVRAAMAGEWWQLLISVSFLLLAADLGIRWKRRNAG